MDLTGTAAGWWTGAVRTLLPQRGALANARDAVARDRWAAAQRREVALAAIQASGNDAVFSPQPHALGPEADVPGADLGGPMGGIPLLAEDRPQVRDVAPHQSFTTAAEEVLALLHERLGLDLWMVTTVRGDQQVIVAATGVGLSLPPSGAQAWAASYCRLMVAGRAPRVAPRVREVAAYSARPWSEQRPFGAYIGAPLLGARGSLFGTVCGLSSREQADTLHQGLPAVERVARLLSTLLSKESVAAERAQAAATAYALAERDPVTGLLNRAGWEKRLVVEEQRCHRYGHPAAVVVVDLAARHAAQPIPELRGDQLQAAARLLARTCRSVDTLARPGTGGFAVLAVECNSAQAAGLAHRLRGLFLAAGLAPAVGLCSRSPECSLLRAWDRALERTSPIQHSPIGHR